MNLFDIVLIILIGLGIPFTFSKKQKLRTYSVGLISLGFLIVMIESAMEHDFNRTALTGIMVFLYFIVFYHRIRNRNDD